MAGTTGLEPAASAVTGQRSNQLNYVPAARDDFSITGGAAEDGQLVAYPSITVAAHRLELWMVGVGHRLQFTLARRRFSSSHL